MKVIKEEGLPFAKLYNYYYYGIKCTHSCSSHNIEPIILFKENMIYPLLSSSLDLYGVFDAEKRMSMISENGYKMDFLPKEASMYFDVHSLYLFVPKLFK